MKVAFISNHPAPYRDPLLNRLVKEPSVNTFVYSLFPMDKGHSFWELSHPEYENIVLVPKSKSRFIIFLNLLRKFVFGDFDLVVWPGFLLWYLTASMFVSAILGRRYGFSADTVEQSHISRFAFLIKRFIIRRAAIVIVPGKASKKYFAETFGVNPERICEGAYALDQSAIKTCVSEIRKSRNMLRQKFGIGESDKVFLMVANMIPTRHYPITTAGFLVVAANKRNTKFIIVGKGADNARMHGIANMHPELIVVDGVSFKEMMSLYALADVYVHGGKEPASTALVIGAASGLPLLSSDAVGCSADCLDEQSGYKVGDYLNEKSWAEGFMYMLDHKDDWPSMGRHSIALAEKLDVKSALTSFLDIIRRA